MTDHDDTAAPPAPEEIAPHTTIEIAFDIDSAGNEIAVVEGMDVTPRLGEDARDAAIRTVADMVDTVGGVDEFGNPYRYLRARVVGDSENRSVVIHRDGRLFVSIDGGHPMPAWAAAKPPDQANPADPEKAAAPQPATSMDDELGRAASVLVGAEPEPTPSPSAPSHTTSPTTSPTASRPATRSPDATEPAGAAERAGSPVSADSTTASDSTPTSGGPRALLRGTLPVSRRSRREGAAENGGRLRGSALRGVLDPKRHRRPGRAGKAGPEKTSMAAGADGGVATEVPAAAEDRAVRRQRLIEEARRSAEAPQRRAPSRSVALIVVAALTVVCAIVLVAEKLGVGHTPAAVAAVLPVTPPPEWAREATWSTGPLAVEAGQSVAVGDAVAYVTSGRQVVLADVVTGEPRWRLDLPTGPIRGPLSRTRLVDTDSLALHVGDRLLVWSAETGKAVAAVDLPAQAQVTYLGAAPLVGVGPDKVAVVGSRGLSEITVPEGAYALAARTDSSVTAASPAGWWHLQAERPAGPARPWENPSADVRPADSAPAIAGYTGDAILLLYPAFRGSPPEVVVHTDRAADVRASFRGPAISAGSARGSWVASPSENWGVLGRTLVNLRAGSVSDLGAWQTHTVTGDRAFGQVGGQTVTAGPDSAPAVLPDGTQPPETVTTEGAVIRLRGPVTDAAGAALLREGEEAGFVVPPAS